MSWVVDGGRKWGVLSLTALAATAAEARDFSIDFDARAYFESAYLSSGGVLSYTEPVAEQYAFLKTHFWDYGWLRFDAWVCSALNDQTDSVHRRYAYICEDTLMYGYDWAFADRMKLTTSAGVLWDFLFGYEKETDFPIFWYADQYLHNPYLTPYWNGLGNTEGKGKVRLRVGVQHQFLPFESLTITPFAETTWGDKARFEANYGEEPENEFLGGAIMFATFGISAEWRFWEHWYVWGRYRQYLILDSQAWDLVENKDSPTAKTAFPIFGPGVGCRF